MCPSHLVLSTGRVHCALQHCMYVCTRMYYDHGRSTNSVAIMAQTLRIGQQATQNHSVQFNWRTFNSHAFLGNLRLIDWNSVVRSSDSCEQQWNSFSSVLMQNLNIHCPLWRFRVCNPTPPPVSDETLELMKQRCSAKAAGDRNTYISLDTRTKRAIRSDMQKWYAGKHQAKSRWIVTIDYFPPDETSNLAKTW